MGNYRDLQVWGTAHKLTLAIYRDTHDFPKEERFGSGAELSYHLLLARDLDFLKNTEYSRLNSDLEEVLRMLSSLSQKVRNAVAA